VAWYGRQERDGRLGTFTDRSDGVTQGREVAGRRGEGMNSPRTPNGMRPTEEAGVCGSVQAPARHGVPASGRQGYLWAETASTLLQRCWWLALQLTMKGKHASH
jgi:hypothetical protein